MEPSKEALLKAWQLILFAAKGMDITPGAIQLIKETVGCKYPVGSSVWIFENNMPAIVNANVESMKRQVNGGPFWYRLREDTGRNIAHDIREDLVFPSREELIDYYVQFFEKRREK